MVGTMIEVPRGALTADEIAQTAEFFSFGTNDLTQTALGISRDDMGTFLMPYTENEIVQEEPVRHARHRPASASSWRSPSRKAASTRPDIKLGICGEHGGDPDSVKFCHKLGLDLRELLALTACPSPASPPPRPRSRKSAPRRRSNPWRRFLTAKPNQIKPPRETGAAFLIGARNLFREKSSCEFGREKSRAPDSSGSKPLSRRIQFRGSQLMTRVDLLER